MGAAQYPQWASCAAEQKRMRLVLSRIVLRMQNGSVSSAYEMWCSCTQEQKRLRHAAQKVLLRFKNIAVACAWDAWHDL